MPLPLPGLAPLRNRFLAPLPWINQLCLMNLWWRAHCRRKPPPRRAATVSVVVPARNEAGNIEAAILERTPEMGGGTELIFVEGNSTDDTWAAIERAAALTPGAGSGSCARPARARATPCAWASRVATGDILMILDADLTVPPEELPEFYDAIASGPRASSSTACGWSTRWRSGAMRFLNLLGNKLFGIAFTFLLGQPIKDTLCGTKVL